MRVPVFRIIALSLLLASVVLACSSSQPLPSFNSGVPPERPILEQSDSEQRAFCEEAMRYIDELYPLELAERGECMFGAVFIGLIRGEAACERELARCIAELPPIVGTDLMCAMPDLSPYEGCEATVGEVETCANATAEQVIRFVWPLGCGYLLGLLALDEPAAEINAAIAALREGPCAPLGPTCPYFGVALDELAATLGER